MGGVQQPEQPNSSGHALEDHLKKILSSSRTQDLAELRLSGFDLTTLEPMEEEALIAALDRRRSIQYLSTLAVTNAINDLAQIMVSGGGEFKNSRSVINQLRALVFPDIAEETESKTEKTRRILEREYARGPLKVKAMDYTKRRKKRR